jgi:hypothetical protein
VICSEEDGLKDPKADFGQKGDQVIVDKKDGFGKIIEESSCTRQKTATETEQEELAQAIDRSPSRPRDRSDITSGAELTTTCCTAS